jgi:hypothetical protein
VQNAYTNYFLPANMSARSPSEDENKQARHRLDDIHMGFGSDEDDSSDDDVNPELSDAKELKSFKKTTLWEGKDLPYYDGRKAGPTNVPPAAKDWTGLEWFLTLFPVVMFEHIVVHTNLYYLQEEPVGRAPMLTVHELFVWLGLHIKMMMHWSGTQDSYFSGDAGFDATIYMSRRRFYWVKKYLHFNDKTQRPARSDPNHDECYLVRPLLDAINKTLRKYWKCSEFMSMDEMMIAFKGHNPFHRWIPRKPHPNGFKLHALCDARHYVCVGLMLDDNVSYGIPQIAAKLFKNNVVAGMTIVTDRYYTCTELVRLCIKRQVGFVGMTMHQRFLGKHALPGWDQKRAKQKDRGTFEVATNGDRSICCVAWKDKGAVLLTATVSTTAKCLIQRNESGRESFEVRAPICCQTFDAYFHGVDRNDQLRGSGYGLALHFKAHKYTIKFFLGIIDILLSNAWLYWRWYHQKKKKEHRWWVNNLADDMMCFNPLGEPVTPSGRQRQPQSRIEHTLRRFRVSAKTKRRMRATCPMCSEEKRCRTTLGCPVCKVPLHPACSVRWHNLSETERLKKRQRLRNLFFEEQSEGNP